MNAAPLTEFEAAQLQRDLRAERLREALERAEKALFSEAAAELAENNGLRLGTRRWSPHTVERLLTAVEWFMAAQHARNEKWDYAKALALALGDVRHAVVEDRVCARFTQLQQQLARKFAAEP